MNPGREYQGDMGTESGYWEGMLGVYRYWEGVLGW